jgi:hypothetical protein
LARRTVQEQQNAGFRTAESSSSLPGRRFGRPRLAQTEEIAESQTERAQPADLKQVTATQTVAETFRVAEYSQHYRTPSEREGFIDSIDSDGPAGII